MNEINTYATDPPPTNPPSFDALLSIANKYAQTKYADVRLGAPEFATIMNTIQDLRTRVTTLENTVAILEVELAELEATE